MLDTGVIGSGVTDPLNLRLDRGNDASIRQQYLIANYVYDLPFGTGGRFESSSRLLNLIIGRWQTTGIITLGSGLPYSVTFSSAVQGWPSNYADRIGNPHVDHPSLAKWFNPAAFAPPAQFTYGNSGARQYFGPHYANWDTSIERKFSLSSCSRCISGGLAKAIALVRRVSIFAPG